MANTKLPARLLDTSAIPALNVTGDLTVDTTTLKVDSTNNRVGIGIASPNALLHIKTSDPATNQAVIDFRNPTYGIFAQTNSISSRGNTLEFIASDYNNNSPTTHDVITLRPEGNVGIGVTDPLNKFVVAHQSHGVAIDYVGSTLPYQPGIFTSSTAHTQTAYGDLNIKARSDYGPNYGIGFFTANSANAPTLRMKIAADGNVGIGGAAIPSAANLYIQDASDSRLIIYETGTSPYTSTLELASQAIGTYGALVQYTSQAERLTIENYGRTIAANSYSGSIAFKTKLNNTTPTEVMFIHGFTGNVGIGTNNPTGILEVAAGAPTIMLNANTQATDKKKVRIALSQYTAGDFNIQQMNDAGTTVLQNALTITNAGNIAVGGTSAPNAPTHKQNTTITSSNSPTGTWTAPAAGGTYVARNSIEVGGILNRHIGKWGFSGNFSANTWYPFVKRSELTSMYRSAGGSEDGFTLYFRIYLYPTTSGIGEYFSNRMSEMVYIQNSGSNSVTWHELRVGAGWGHAPNAGTDFDPDGRFSGFGPVRLRIQHHLGTDSNFPAEQTIDINFASAATGLNPTVAGRQVLIYGYML